MKNAIFIAVIFLCSILNAQNVKIQGSVKDSLGDPLELASVIATKKAGGGIENYAIADATGAFEISLPDGVAYVFTINYLGMETVSRDIDLSSKTTSVDLDFVLYPANNQLEGVELRYQMPITMRGDTIIYNTGSFTNGNDRKLGDVLKKLPGIEVSDNGDIKVDGQKVSKVMVNGKDFFDGDSKLATNNIPADAFSKVEVLKKYNEVDQMRGLGNNQNNIAINIKLKEGKENFWFGNLEGALGEGEGTRHQESTKLFYYSPETSLSLLGNSNNTGDASFTFNDYINFTRAFRNLDTGGTSLNIGDNGPEFLVTQNNRANELQTHFGATNFTHNVSDSWSLSGFTIYSDNEVNILQRSLRSFLQTNATEVNTSNSDVDSRLAMGKFSTIYKPKSYFQIDYDIMLKNSRQLKATRAVSVFSDEGTLVENPITEKKENQSLSLNQSLNLYYTLNDRNIFAGYLRHLYQDEDPFYNVILQVQPFIGTLPLIEQEGDFNIGQKKKVQTRKFDSRLDYYHVINALSNINLTLGSTLGEQDFNTAIFQFLNTGTANFFEEDFLNNEVRYNFQDFYLGVKYKFKKRIFTFTPGLTLHNYHLRTVQSEAGTTENKTLLLLDFSAIAQFRQSESLRFNYKMTADFPEVTKLAEDYVFNSYSRLFKGNRKLENAIFHTFSLNYFNFNMFNFTNINAGINYSKRIDAIRNNTSIENINQMVTLINSNFTDETLNVNASYQKTFRKFIVNIQSILAYNSFNSVVNDLVRNSRSLTQNYKGSLQTNFRNTPNFEVGYNRITNAYNNAGVKSTFDTDRPYASIEMNFLKSFRFDADYNYYNYSNRENTIRNEYAFLNGSLLYRKDGSKWEFQLKATNLLNVKSINSDSFNENFNVSSEYFILPRIVMGSVKYYL